MFYLKASFPSLYLVFPKPVGNCAFAVHLVLRLHSLHCGAAAGAGRLIADSMRARRGGPDGRVTSHYSLRGTVLHCPTVTFLHTYFARKLFKLQCLL